MSVEERADPDIRRAHLLRVHSYMDIAILSMWTNNPRVDVMLGMSEGSLRGAGPDDREDALLKRLRGLVGEARGYLADDEFPAAMARMRVAQDLVALYLIDLSGE